MPGDELAARRPSGAAVPRQQVTDAIRDATFRSLAEVGYGRLSIEAIAKRAGVSKTAIYRRWPSIQALVVDLATAAAIDATEIPDTGTLLGDLRAFLQTGYEVLTRPLVSMILPDLLAETARSPEFAELFIATVRDPRRALVAQMIKRAVARGEVSTDIAIECALDLIVGALYWRVAVVRMPVSAGYLEQLAQSIHAALTAQQACPARSGSAGDGSTWA